MKRWIFTIAVLILLTLVPENVVNAEVLTTEEGGIYKFTYTADIGETSTNYYFEFFVYDKPTYSSVIVRYYDSEGELNYICTLNAKEWETDENGTFLKGAYDGKASLINSLDIQQIVVCFNIDGTDLSDVNILAGTLVDSSEDEPDPTPEITPEVTPDVEEPDPTPEITPDPTPTSTPTPTPTEAPILELNAFVTSKDAVAQYKTGGCTPVKSTIEFYEVDTSADILTKINSEQFISGTGTMRNNMTPGKVYRYKLTYIYQRNGIQYEKFLWSDDLSIVDQELEDYRTNKKITNFRTLMLYVWEDVMALELPVEGFHISFQTFFIWIMVALAILGFIKYFKD